MKFLALLKQDFRNIATNPTNIFMFFIFPTMLILLLGFLFSNMYQSDLLNSYDFYGVTMIFFTAMMGSTVPANAFMEERIKAGNVRIFYAPVSKVQVYLSKLIACFLFMGFLLSLNVVILSSTGLVNFGGANIIFVIIMLLSLIMFFTILSGAICVSVKSEEITNTILSNLMAVFGLLSGIFFPIASLGEWMDKVSNLSPLKWVLNSIFELIYDGTSENYVLILICLSVISLLLLLIVHRNYKPEDYI